MISFFCFALLVNAEVNCDGEVTTCADCVASTESFAQCQWCSTSGRCNGKFDLTSTCPNNGVWQSTCSAVATISEKSTSSEKPASTLRSNLPTTQTVVLRTFDELYQDTSDTPCDRNQILVMRVCFYQECGPINSLCDELNCAVYCVRDFPAVCANYYKEKCESAVQSLKQLGEKCDADCSDGGKKVLSTIITTRRNVACLKNISLVLCAIAALFSLN